MKLLRIVLLLLLLFNVSACSSCCCFPFFNDSTKWHSYEFTINSDSKVDEEKIKLIVPIGSQEQSVKRLINISLNKKVYTYDGDVFEENQTTASKRTTYIFTLVENASMFLQPIDFSKRCHIVCENGKVIKIIVFVSGSAF